MKYTKGSLACQPEDDHMFQANSIPWPSRALCNIVKTPRSCEILMFVLKKKKPNIAVMPQTSIILIVLAYSQHMEYD